MTRLAYIYWTVAVVALLAGCGPAEQEVLSGGESEEGVSLSFSLGSVDGAIDLSKVKTFRIRIFSGTPYDDNETPLFDSLSIHGCFDATGTDIRIQDLKAGEGRFVYYEGFSDAACADLFAVGIRGGIHIQKQSALQKEAAGRSCTADDACAELHPDAHCDCEKDKDSEGKKLPYCKGNATSVCAVTAPVYVPLYQVGEFNKMPVPSGDLLNDAMGVSCEGDTDCAEVHKAAVCDQDAGYCTVTGLFPFSPSRPRAFHTANALTNGKIMFVGGFNREKGGEVFYAGSPFFEIYDPYTGLFERPLVQDNYGGQNVGMHRASLLGTDRMVVSGGVSEIKLGYQLGDALKLRLEIPHAYTNNCPDAPCTNFSKSVLAANYINGTYIQGTLPQRVFSHRSSLVSRGTDSLLLLSGGIVFDDNGQTYPSNQHILCTAADILDGDTNVSCALSENTDAFPPRFSHADACLVGGEDGEPCTEYVVFGGVEEGDPSGEVFSSSADPINSLLPFHESTSLNKVHFSELARVADQADEQPAKLYSFGGVSNVTRKNNTDSETLTIDFPAPDMQPQQVNINLNESNNSMTTAGLNLTSMEDHDDVYRLFHAVAVLDGGRIALIGGLGEDRLPTKSVLFFEDPAVHALAYVGKAKMGTSRFGHSATVIKAGLLKGAMLVVGGFTILDKETGTIQFAQGAEIYIPAP